MNDTVYKNQYGIIMFFIPLVFKMAVLPALITQMASNDAYITIFFMTILEFVQLLPIYYIANRGLLDDIKSDNKWLYRGLLLPYLGVFMLKLMVFGMEISYYVTTFMFFDISHTSIVVVLFLVIFYVATRGGRAIGRLSILLLWFLPALIILGATFGKTNLRFDFLLPFFGNAKGIFSSVDKYLFWMFDFSPLLFIKIADKRKPTLWISAVAGVLAVTLAYILFLTNYGKAGMLIDCAFARMASFNVISTDVGSIDWPGTMLWLLAATLSLSLKAYAAGEIIKDFSVKSAYGIGGFMLAALLLTLFVTSNVQKSTELAVNPIVRYLVAGIEIFIPIIIIAVAIAKRRKHKEKVVV